MAACTRTRYAVYNYYSYRTRIIQNISDIIVEIIEVVKSSSYMELEDNYFEENEKCIFHYLYL